MSRQINSSQSQPNVFHKAHKPEAGAAASTAFNNVLAVCKEHGKKNTQNHGYSEKAAYAVSDEGSQL